MLARSPAPPSGPRLLLYHAPRSRSFRVLWMLEELGEPYAVRHVDLRGGARRQPDHVALSPTGEVPTLCDGEVVVSESAAICAYLADRYPTAGLAPARDARERADYLKWLFFAVGSFEPAVIDSYLHRESPSLAVGWESYDRVVAALSGAVGRDRYLLGERFTAADIVIGSAVHLFLGAGLLPDDPFAGYVERLARRPALQRAFARDGGEA